MNINANGVLTFDDVFELTYELFNELEFEVRPDGTIYDSIGNNILYFNTMALKASINPNQIHYPGVGEIAFDILGNIRLMTYITGLYLTRRQQAGMPFRSYYPEEITDDTGLKFSNLTIKFDDYNTLSTKYYHNKCLKFIELIFLLEDNNVDLSNFDNLMEEEK